MPSCRRSRGERANKVAVRSLPCALCLLLASATLCAQTPKAAQAPAVPAKPPTKTAAPASQPVFDRLVEQATAARTAQNWDEAIALYAKAVKLRPSYVE